MKDTSDFDEVIDLTVEPWATLAPLCWNYPSVFRLGMMAEKHGVDLNPYTKRDTIALFNEGRETYRKYARMAK